MDKCQIGVVGGGMIGAATALGLALQGFQVAVVEHRAPTAFSIEQPMDLRVSAISMASVELLRQLGVWERIEAMRMCPYRHLETWDLPEHPIRFASESLGLAQLGFMVENRVIQLALWQRLAELPNVKMYCPDSVATITVRQADVSLSLACGQTLVADWVIGADGANSKIREFAHIGSSTWDYRQHCMLISVKTTQDQQNTTWQQFCPTGPRSFLPFIDHQASLVWYDSPQRIALLMAMPISQLEAEIHQSFPERLGPVSVVDRASFPLTRRHAHTYSQQRCVLLGDAAHTINPLAGQGVNLGFKDVRALLDEVSKTGEMNQSCCARYERRRRPDNVIMQTGMDVFYHAFRIDFRPFQFGRSLVLTALNHAEGLKKQVIRYAVGL